MPSHWTYCEFREDSDLQQGDIIWPTVELKSALHDVYPYLFESSYSAFLVVTQSCDLVRREGGCKSRYINLAVVRSIKNALPDLFPKVARPIVDGVYASDDRTKSKLLEFMSRVINQNEQALGLFYLHPDAEAGIATHSIAFLQVCYSFRVEHYDRLVTSRRGRLESSFQNRLGWLVGNLYSRTAVIDWTEKDEEAGKRLPVQLLDSVFDGENLLWVKGAAARIAEKNGIRIADLPRHEVGSVLNSLTVPSPRDVALEAVDETVLEVCPEVTSQMRHRLRTKLRSHPKFTAAVPK